MDAIYPCVAGLDVHKQTIVSCARRCDDRGRVSKQVKTFGTMTRDLLELGDWLRRQGVTHVAMESTGVYWKPVFHLLEGRFTEILVVGGADGPIQKAPVGVIANCFVDSHRRNSPLAAVGWKSSPCGRTKRISCRAG